MVKDPVLIARFPLLIVAEPEILTVELETINGGFEYCPIFTVLSEKTSITGTPEIVFTENKDPDKPSTTENN
jgi:hypothetical protein